MVIFGVDLVTLVIGLFGNLFPVLADFLPPAFGATGEWANCVAQYGLTADECKGM